MSLKRLVSLGLGLSWLAAESVFAGGSPRGNLIELHSCEVYAGGCVISSEATQGGRCLLQVWDLTGGSWKGTELGGLVVAVLESSSENLAAAQAHADQTVIYLPEAANAAQRAALLAWLKSRDPQLGVAKIQTRVVPTSLTTSATKVTFTAGKFASVQVASLGNCENRVCGEDLWYTPAATTSIYTVGLNAGSQINEPLVDLKWTDHGKRSVFLACFGEAIPAQNIYVKSSDWCGSIGNFF
jgi:hypothetical protein